MALPSVGAVSSILEVFKRETSKASKLSQQLFGSFSESPQNMNFNDF